MRTYSVAGALAALLLFACTTELPAVDPTLLACVDARAAADGLLQCPASHWCQAGACTPRLGCQEPDSSVPGCEDGRRRCDLVTSDDSSAAACVSGLHTDTSTPVVDLDDCPCPDGLHCVALADVRTASTPRALPLYHLPATLRPARLPAATLGAVGERSYGRLCVRACSSERDCGAGATCRATAVLAPSTLAGADLGRHTVGMCYPDILTTTTTLAEQLERDVCRARSDCTVRLGQLNGDCVVRVDPVLDHPTRPAGSAWGERFALVPHCVSDPNGALDGLGCTEDASCQSGVCVSRRCARLCDPSLSDSCGASQVCNQVEVQRDLTGGRTLYDRVFVCGG